MAKPWFKFFEVDGNNVLVYQSFNQEDKVESIKIVMRLFEMEYCLEYSFPDGTMMTKAYDEIDQNAIAGIFNDIKKVVNEARSILNN